jgi:mono/diheme cytochrome c family protein
MRLSSIFGLLLAVVCVSAACGHGGGSAGASASSGAVQSAASENGRLIFQTGRDSAGKQITAAEPPLRPSCAACHGANGAGGVHLPGGAVSADLRHNALVVGQKHRYTLALLERAITTGLDNDGQPLNTVMPHWRLSQRDLHDVASYVLTGLK